MPDQSHHTGRDLPGASGCALGGQTRGLSNLACYVVAREIGAKIWRFRLHLRARHAGEKLNVLRPKL